METEPLQMVFDVPNTITEIRVLSVCIQALELTDIKEAERIIEYLTALHEDKSKKLNNPIIEV